MRKFFIKIFPKSIIEDVADRITTYLGKYEAKRDFHIYCDSKLEIYYRTKVPYLKPTSVVVYIIDNKGSKTRVYDRGKFNLFTFRKGNWMNYLLELNEKAKARKKHTHDNLRMQGIGKFSDINDAHIFGD